MRILLVEDTKALREMVAIHLKGLGFAVDAVSSGEQALAAAAAAAAAYDAMILDLGLPGIDGMAVLKRLRRAGSGIPALILTARDAIENRIDGLDAGADDYILKPFELTELAARLRAVLRRPGSRRDPKITYGDLSFDTASRLAWVTEDEISLPRREAALLEALLRAGGTIVVKDALEDRLYGFDDEVSGNAIEATVSRVRRKLAAAQSGVRIEAVRGIGYRLAFGGAG